MSFNVILAFKKCCEKNVKLNGINGLMSRYWYCLGREGNVVDECLLYNPKIKVGRSHIALRSQMTA